MKQAEELARKHQYTSLEKIISQELDALLEPLEKNENVLGIELDTISEIGIDSSANLLKTTIDI